MWYYNNEPFEDIGEYVGFVYLITNLTNNKKYIGKKIFHFTKTKQVKKKKKRVKVESDWKEYFGSNKNLNEDVESLGKGNFKREIIRLCRTKGECSYFEAKEQFERNALLLDEYYNEYMLLRVSKSHLTSLKQDGKIL
jgi:hypothetical protein